MAEGLYGGGGQESSIIKDAGEMAIGAMLTTGVIVARSLLTIAGKTQETIEGARPPAALLWFLADQRATRVETRAKQQPDADHSEHLTEGFIGKLVLEAQRS